MFEFQCGDLIDVRRRQTSAYTVANKILISKVSSVKQLRSQIVAARNDVSYDQTNSDEPFVSSMVDETPSSNWLPYSYGNPVVNLGGNLLYRIIKQAGIAPPMHDETQY